MKNLAADMFQGSFIVTCTLFAFIGLVWLREQILHGGGPEWLDQEEVEHDHGINRPVDQPLAERLDEVDNNNVSWQIGGLIFAQKCFFVNEDFLPTLTGSCSA